MLDLHAYKALLSDGKVALVAMTHMSNVLGTFTPAHEIADLAHSAGALVLFDGSQSVVHRKTDVQALGADFYTFTGHKLYGPTGIGVLWARKELLEIMPPFMGGGDMISTVTIERSTWANIPHKFEAGTPAIIETIGLGAALTWLHSVGFDIIAAHEARVTAYAIKSLQSVPGLNIVGRPNHRVGLVSFLMSDVHPHDIATLLDRNGIAIRAGHHCAEPLMCRLGLTATARESFGIYTTEKDIDIFVDALHKIKKIF